jgi:hypothetical protein
VFEFLKARQAANVKKKQTARERYRDLLKKSAETSGKLSTADVAAANVLMDELKITPEQWDADAEIVAEADKLEALAGGREANHTKRRQLMTAARAFDVETDRIVKERAATRYEMEKALGKVTVEWQTGERAAEQVEAIKNKNRELFGLETPTPVVAAVLPGGQSGPALTPAEIRQRFAENEKRHQDDSARLSRRMAESVDVVRVDPEELRRDKRDRAQAAHDRMREAAGVTN